MADDELGPLPAGRHGFSREQVAHHQRERLIAGLASAVAAKGYAAVTLADVTAEARVSRRVFYEHFESKEECFLAAFEAVVAHLRELAAEAAAPEQSWPRQALAALRAALAFLAAEPGLARLCLVEAPGAGLAVAERFGAPRPRPLPPCAPAATNADRTSAPSPTRPRTRSSAHSSRYSSARSPPARQPASSSFSPTARPSSSRPTWAPPRRPASPPTPRRRTAPVPETHRVLKERALDKHACRALLSPSCETASNLSELWPLARFTGKPSRRGDAWEAANWGSAQRRDAVRRITILLTALAALMLVPVASAFAEEMHVTITGHGEGEVTSGSEGEFEGEPALACSYDGENQSNTCDNEFVYKGGVNEFEGYGIIALNGIAAPGSHFVEWIVEEGAELGGCGTSFVVPCQIYVELGGGEEGKVTALVCLDGESQAECEANFASCSTC